jgi:hypothetical protein
MAAPMARSAAANSTCSHITSPGRSLSPGIFSDAAGAAGSTEKLFGRLSARLAKKRRGWGVPLGGLPTAASLAAVREVGNPSFTERRQLASGPRPG